MKFPFVSREQSDARIAELKERIAFLQEELDHSKTDVRELTNAIAATNRSVVPFGGAKRSSAAAPIRKVDPFHEAKRLEKLTRSSYELGTMPGRPLWSYPEDKKPS